MEELPFKAEYAKSGRSGCKACKRKIGQDTLRLAIIFDNVLQRLVTLKDLVRFESKIKHHASVVAEPNTQKKGTKRLAETDAKMIKEASEDFGIEYSRTSRAKCRECAITITKGEIRIKKILYDTEVASRFGNQAAWYHYECFAKHREELGWFGPAEQLSGFKKLNKEDQDLIEKHLPPMKTGEVMPETKKQKAEG